MTIQLSFDEASLICAAMEEGLENGNGTTYEVLLAKSIIKTINNAEADGLDLQNR